LLAPLPAKDPVVARDPSHSLIGAVARLEKATSSHRYECKYVVNERQTADLCRFIAPWVAPDEHCRSQDRYPIASLYLDSPDLALCRATAEGQHVRFKLRVRSYTDDPDKPVFLEIKHRRNTVISKVRAAVPREQLGAMLSAGSPIELGDDTHGAGWREFSRQVGLLQARPVVLVRYVREAYVALDNPKTRVTLDRKIMSAVSEVPIVRLGGGGWSPVDSSTVLELKFTGRCPAWMAMAIQQLELRRQSYSKYLNSVVNEDRDGLQVSL